MNNELTNEREEEQYLQDCQQQLENDEEYKQWLIEINELN